MEVAADLFETRGNCIQFGELCEAHRRLGQAGKARIPSRAPEFLAAGGGLVPLRNWLISGGAAGGPLLAARHPARAGLVESRDRRRGGERLGVRDGQGRYDPDALGPGGRGGRDEHGVHTARRGVQGEDVLDRDEIEQPVFGLAGQVRPGGRAVRPSRGGRTPAAGFQGEREVRGRSDGDRDSVRSASVLGAGADGAGRLGRTAANAMSTVAAGLRPSGSASPPVSEAGRAASCCRSSRGWRRRAAAPRGWAAFDVRPDELHVRTG